MSSISSTRRPGIVFQTVSPTPPNALPRMDVAGFVGFASRGPVDVPVPVDGLERFLDVFGPPVPLLRDPETGRTITSQLGHAVDTFFRNGGQRCWVVRVAEDPERRWFVVPGLVDAETGIPAVARARSLGSGFDDVRVSTVVRRQSLRSATVRRDGSRWRLAWPIPPKDLAPGAMIRLTRPGHPTLGSAEVFLPIASLTNPADRANASSVASPPMGSSPARSETIAVSDPPFAFRRVPEVPAPPGGWSASVSFVDDAAALPTDAPGAKPSTTYGAQVYQSSRGLRIHLNTTVPLPAVGHVVHVHLTDGRTAWARVDAARNASEAGTAYTQIVAVEQRWPVDPDGLIPDATPIPPAPPSSGSGSDAPWVCEVVSFDLLTWRGEDVRRRLERLQFVDDAPRGWTQLPVDADLFRVNDGRAISPPPDSLAAGLYDDVVEVAGPGTQGGRFVPFGMDTRPDPSGARGPVSAPGSALRRNGLFTFSNSLFLDEHLADATTGQLVERAPERLMLPEEPETRGLHTLWSIREVTLVAVPDAIHRGWASRTVDLPTSTVPAPEGLAVGPCANDRSILCVDWESVSLDEASEIAGPVTYEVQESTAPDFSLSTLTYEGSATEAERPITAACPSPIYIRVRAVTPEAVSPWSETVEAVVPSSTFRPERASLPRPAVEAVTAPGGEAGIQWSRVPSDDALSPPGDLIAYDLQRAPDPAMERAETVAPDAVAVVDSRTFAYTVERDIEPVYLRVRARRTDVDRPGPWSETVVVPPRAEPQVAPASPAEFEEPDEATPNRGREGLIDLQHAILRFCAARGDVFAMLSLPLHQRTEEAQAHVSSLTRIGAPGSPDPTLRIPDLRVGEERTLSFGAVYHPWTTVASIDGTATVPPDGAACGVAATRALQDGAWRAPANVPIDRALALRPNLGTAGFELLSAPVNVLSLGPRGVQFEGASTLAADASLRPISTRRLLSLLLRLARREGPALVFESNTAALRRDAAALFDRLLRSLYDQGALAGRTAREAYRVVTDTTVNTPETVRRGQLIVEVRVAPATPLEFIVVRLVQRGGQITAASERLLTAPR